MKTWKNFFVGTLQVSLLLTTLAAFSSSKDTLKKVQDKGIIESCSLIPPLLSLFEFKDNSKW